MRKLIRNTLMAWGCGYSLGLLLGFGDINGFVYYDVTSGVCMGAILGCACAVACWVIGCKELGENDD